MNKLVCASAHYLHIGAALGLSLFALYTAATGVMVDMIQRGVVLLLVMILVFTKPIAQKDTKWYHKLFLIFMLTVSSVALIYQLVNYKQLAISMGAITPFETALGIILIVSLWSVTKMKVGWPIVIISSLFVLYARFGNLLPGMIAHRGYSIKRIVSHMVVGTNGIFGTPLGTAATMVVVFILFGCFLEASGGTTFFMDLAIALTGKSRGGPAKAAVISSALMGTISGNAASNVVTTGTFTIPLMKRTGYSSCVSGAIEAVASTGGQIMPPVMGAAAFIMAEMIGTSYGTVAMAAVIPSILYYVSVFFMVHFEAVKCGVSSMSANDIPDLKSTWRMNCHTLVSIVVLVGALAMGYSAVRAALFGTVTAFVCSFFRKHTWITFKKLYETLIAAAEGAITVVVACSCAGLIIGSVSLTGLGLKLSSLIIAVSGGHVLLALLLTFVVLFILGMGMPTAAAYIMVATLVAPGLTDMGLPVIAAHMFCLYGAVLSAITPPVALAAYAAAGIAKDNPIKIGFTACKFGIVAFIVPFFFAYQPALVWMGKLSDILIAMVTSIIGVIALAMGIQGYGRRKVIVPLRICAVVGALMMIYPGLATDVVGFVLIILSILPQLKKDSVGS